MKRDIRFAARVVINPAQFESLELILDETIHLDETSDVERERARLIRKVTSTLESEVLKARADIEHAKRSQRK